MRLENGESSILLSGLTYLDPSGERDFVQNFWKKIKKDKKKVLASLY